MVSIFSSQGPQSSRTSVLKHLFDEDIEASGGVATAVAVHRRWWSIVLDQLVEEKVLYALQTNGAQGWKSEQQFGESKKKREQYFRGFPGYFPGFVHNYE